MLKLIVSGRRAGTWAVRRSWFGSAALTPSFFGAFGCLFEAVGFAVDCDDLGVVDKTIDQGGFDERTIGVTRVLLCS